MYGDLILCRIYIAPIVDGYTSSDVLLFVMFSCSEVSLKINALLNDVNENSGLTIAPPLTLV